MKRSELREFGLSQLALIENTDDSTNHCNNSLEAYEFNPSCLDDDYSWLTCVLGLKAAVHGNFGIGALLVDSTGNVLEWGHNEVFYPYFRSDRHAEMVVLSQFEEEHRTLHKVGAFSLYTSLEPCPMCLARLITSGMGTVRHVAADPTGGMVHIMKNLPEVWLELSAKRVFASARCSARLSEFAKEIFLLNVDGLNKKLERRCI
ncbi:MAG: nucleoside deaminase [Chloroflexi bacterium]|nr:nucleoside deaminase [Chloroflexota bacterium]